MISEELHALRKRAVAQFEATADFNTAVELAFTQLAEHLRKMPPGTAYAAEYPVELTYPALPGSRVHPAHSPDYLSHAHGGFTQALLLQHMVALFEHALFDAFRLLLRDRPQRIRKRDRTLEYSTILDAGTLGEVIESMIDREVLDLSSKGPRAWMAFAARHVSASAVSEPDIDALVELKATRNLLVHNGGIVNAIYLAKAGDRARAVMGASIPVTVAYVQSAWELLTRILVHIIDAFCKAADSENGRATA